MLLPQEGQSGLIDFYRIIKKHLPPINASNAVLHRQSILDAGGFHPEQRMHEDRNEKGTLPELENTCLPSTSAGTNRSEFTTLQTLLAQYLDPHVEEESELDNARGVLADYLESIGDTRAKELREGDPEPEFAMDLIEDTFPELKGKIFGTRQSLNYLLDASTLVQLVHVSNLAKKH